MDKIGKIHHLIFYILMSIFLLIVVMRYVCISAMMPFNPGVLTSNHVTTTSLVRGAFMLEKGKIATKMAQIATEISYRI